MKPVIYEPHPVSEERKAELRGLGYKIIDVKFKPADAEEVQEEPAKRQRRTRRNEAE